jgi:hypothetical protein
MIGTMLCRGGLDICKAVLSAAFNSAGNSVQKQISLYDVPALPQANWTQRTDPRVLSFTVAYLRFSTFSPEARP